MPNLLNTRPLPPHAQPTHHPLAHHHRPPPSPLTHVHTHTRLWPYQPPPPVFFATLLCTNPCNPHLPPPYVHRALAASACCTRCHCPPPLAPPAGACRCVGVCVRWAGGRAGGRAGEWQGLCVCVCVCVRLARPLAPSAPLRSRCLRAAAKIKLMPLLTCIMFPALSNISGAHCLHVRPAVLLSSFSHAQPPAWQQLRCILITYECNPLCAGIPFLPCSSPCPATTSSCWMLQITLK